MAVVSCPYKQGAKNVPTGVIFHELPTTGADRLSGTFTTRFHKLSPAFSQSFTHPHGGLEASRRSGEQQLRKIREGMGRWVSLQHTMGGAPD